MGRSSLWRLAGRSANLIRLYRVTYDSEKRTSFIVYREEFGLPDMVFDMHPCGLHVYYPDKIDGQYGFVQTVAENMKLFTKRHWWSITGSSFVWNSRLSFQCRLRICPQSRRHRGLHSHRGRCKGCWEDLGIYCSSSQGEHCTGVWSSQATKLGEGSSGVNKASTEGQHCHWYILCQWVDLLYDV